MTNAERSFNAFEEALCFFGGAPAMARAMGIKLYSLKAALRRGRLSKPMAVRVHKLTSGLVHRESLRPDLFPTPAEMRRDMDELLRLLREPNAKSN
jgi:DNA-binding transcriptional regulator YdaS (Cro superfamily)